MDAIRVTTTDLDAAAERMRARAGSVVREPGLGVPTTMAAYGSPELTSAVERFLTVLHQDSQNLRSALGGAADAYDSCAVAYRDCDRSVQDRMNRAARSLSAGGRDAVAR